MQVLFWDIRKLQEPVDVFCLEKKQDCTRTTGAMCLEYEPTMVICDTHVFMTVTHSVVGHPQQNTGYATELKTQWYGHHDVGQSNAVYRGTDC